MMYNLATLDESTRDKINVDLAASAVVFKERYNMPVVAEQVEREQPVPLRGYFRTRVTFYRQASLNFSRLPYEPRK
ncbi:DNA polymerase III subunit theta [Sodalis-like endosymbiont of Proechinophthirus fluctus]|uniref:DNA polymerase III subunit theta n=1 Tax=Sodalis-like endosymbiont of Proechinophthirus fluctus TaxID=1462730 RepID=UPI0007A8459E|nr:DNA polymerase III subunit theta [Sodalis-like endosymbiont of Proechinophthirus fluctus]KYP95658.1 DNA polymerase III subunit theta [Sodalis-like endosymbiont of Proechinophthirus fluctus]